MSNFTTASRFRLYLTLLFGPLQNLCMRNFKYNLLIWFFIFQNWHVFICCRPRAKYSGRHGPSGKVRKYYICYKLEIITKRFFRILQLKQHEIESKLDGSKVLAVVGGRSERNQHRTRRVLLSSLEVGVVVLGCVVFVGALATAICVICIRRRKRRYGLLKNF